MYKRLLFVLFVVATIFLSACSQTGNVVSNLNDNSSFCVPKYDVNGNDLNSCNVQGAQTAQDGSDAADIDKLLNELDKKDANASPNATGDTVSKDVLIKKDAAADGSISPVATAANATTAASAKSTADVQTNFVKTVKEGDLVELKPRVVDPDGNPIQLNFSPPLDENGKWYTKEGDAGTYIVTITASDGKSVSDQKVKIIVNPLYLPPVITMPDTLTFKEGDRIVLKPQIVDPQGRAIQTTYSGWMSSDTYQTTFDDAGTYAVTLVASNGKKESTKKFMIVIKNVDRAPVIALDAPTNLTEGDLVVLNPKVSDPDGDKVTVSYQTPFNQSGKWQSKDGDVGNYNTTVTATDGTLNTSKTIQFTVSSKNKPPVLQRIPDINVNEGDTVTIKPVALDPNGDNITITFSGWMTSGTYKTNYNDAGTHIVTVKVSDGTYYVTQDVKVIVKDVNRPPLFECVVDC